MWDLVTLSSGVTACLASGWRGRGVKTAEVRNGGGWLAEETSAYIMSPKRASSLEVLSKDQSGSLLLSLVQSLNRPQWLASHHSASLAGVQHPFNATTAGWPCHPVPGTIMELW